MWITNSPEDHDHETICSELLDCLTFTFSTYNLQSKSTTSDRTLQLAVLDKCSTANTALINFQILFFSFHDSSSVQISKTPITTFIRPGLFKDLSQDPSKSFSAYESLMSPVKKKLILICVQLSSRKTGKISRHDLFIHASFNQKLHLQPSGKLESQMYGFKLLNCSCFWPERRI